MILYSNNTSKYLIEKVLGSVGVAIDIDLINDNFFITIKSLYFGGTYKPKYYFKTKHINID